MNKKLAHSIVLLFDVLGIIILWVGIRQLTKFLADINAQSDMVMFSNGSGFFVIGAFILVAHAIIIIEHFFPKLIKKNMTFFNSAVAIGLLFFIATGFGLSSFMKNHVENAGYVYCENASTETVLSKKLVYTKTSLGCDKFAKKIR